MPQRLPLSQCQHRLLVLWYGGTLPVVVLLAAQTLLNTYRGQHGEAWTWLLPNVMPTLSLVTGVVVAQARGVEGETATVSPFAYRVAVLLTVIYLALVVGAVLASPFAESRLDVLRSSNAFLGPMQGLVSSCVGVFFVTSKSADS